MAKKKGSTVSTPEITAYLVGIDYEWAVNALEHQKRNRPLKQSKVKHLAKIIQAGKWVLNGESIVLDQDGILIDGQHRLAALIHAVDKLKMDREKTVIDAVVVNGVSSDAFHTIDQGEKRSLSDVVAISDYSFAPDLAVALRLLAIRLAGKKVSGTGKLDHADNLQLLRNHENLASWVEYVADLTPDDENMTWLRPQSLVSVGYLSTIAYLASLDFDTNKVEDAIKHLVDLDHTEKDCPMVQLRKAFLANRSDKNGKLKRDTIVSMLVKAMKTYLEGGKLTNLKIKGTEHPVFSWEVPDQEASESDSDASEE